MQTLIMAIAFVWGIASLGVAYFISAWAYTCQINCDTITGTIREMAFPILASIAFFLLIQAILSIAITRHKRIQAFVESVGKTGENTRWIRHVIMKGEYARHTIGVTKSYLIFDRHIIPLGFVMAARTSEKNPFQVSILMSDKGSRIIGTHAIKIIMSSKAESSAVAKFFTRLNSRRHRGTKKSD